MKGGKEAQMGEGWGEGEGGGGKMGREYAKERNSERASERVGTRVEERWLLGHACTHPHVHMGLDLCCDEAP